MNRRAGLLVGAIGLPVVLVVAIPLMMTATNPPDALCQLPTAAAAGKFTGEQMTIARTAGQVAAARHLPARAELVILSTGFQESGIRNLTGGDRDSVGWLQQRAGWGTVAQRMNPAYAAGKFFDALVRVPGWESLPVTVAAQRVQISAFPEAYARWVPEAVSLISQLGDVALTDTCATGATDVGGGPSPAGFDHQGNPRTVAQATAYLQSLAGRGIPGYPVLAHCEGYMTRAYGNGGGYPTAISHWNAAGPRTMGSTTVPPRGALVFWHTSNPAGHVALSLGNGIIESTDFNGTSYHAGQLGIGPISAIDKWGPRLGWRAPNFRVGSGN